MSSGIALLLLLGFGVRYVGALAFGMHSRWTPILGWFLCTIAVWVFAGALGAFSSLWLAVAIAALGAIVDYSRRLPYSMPILECMLAGVMAWLSIPVLAPIQFLVIILVIPAIGVVADRLASYCHRHSLRASCVVLTSLALTGASICVPFQMAHLPPSYQHENLFLSISPGLSAESVTLETGAIAWLNRPRGPGPFPGVVFFHGADARGANQPAAVAIRRAFLHAGFVVLAVDHPGFGSSPTVPAASPIEMWDPLPTGMAALDYLRARADVKELYIAGHSMGCADVLRLLGKPLDLTGAVLLGASQFEKRGNYWYERFHRDRRMSERLPREALLEINERFYNRERFAAEMQLDHAPLLDIRFDYEAKNIQKSRDHLFALIPGSKQTWYLNGTHYMNALEQAHVHLSHTSPVLSLARRLTSFAAETHSGEIKRSSPTKSLNNGSS